MSINKVPREPSWPPRDSSSCVTLHSHRRLEQRQWTSKAAGQHAPKQPALCNCFPPPLFHDQNKFLPGMLAQPWSPSTWEVDKGLPFARGQPGLQGDPASRGNTLYVPVQPLVGVVRPYHFPWWARGRLLTAHSSELASAWGSPGSRGNRCLFLSRHSVAVLISNSIFWLLKSPKELSRWARNPAKGNSAFFHNLSVLPVSSEKGTRPTMSKSLLRQGGLGEEWFVRRSVHSECKGIILPRK